MSKSISGIVTYLASWCAPFRGHPVVVEILEALHGLAGGRLRDHHRPFEARLQVIQNTVDRVGIGRRQRIHRGHVVGFDDHVLLLAQRRTDLVVDGLQRVVRVFAPVVALDQGNRRWRYRPAARYRAATVRERLRLRSGEQPMRQQRARAAQEQTSRKISWHKMSLQSKIGF
jgi:hypothetical protein